MDFIFDPVPALVESIPQKKKRNVTFIIKEIGGPEEIIKWRQMQEAKESVYRMRLKEKDDRIVAFEKEIGAPLSRGTVSERTLAEKISSAKEDIKRMNTVEDWVDKYPPWTPIEKPKPTLKQRFFNLCKKIWISANR